MINEWKSDSTIIQFNPMLETLLLHQDFKKHVHAVSVSKIILYEKDLDYNAAYMYYKLGRRQSGREQKVDQINTK